jgi:hypothetical protein
MLIKAQRTGIVGIAVVVAIYRLHKPATAWGCWRQRQVCSA